MVLTIIPMGQSKLSNLTKNIFMATFKGRKLCTASLLPLLNNPYFSCH